jgi:hypothetical protein
VIVLNVVHITLKIICFVELSRSHFIFFSHFIFRYLSKDAAPPLIAGEVTLNIIQHVRYTLFPGNLRNPPPPFVGNLYFTSYRLVFRSYVRGHASANTKYEISSYFDELSVPLSTIMRLEPLKSDSLYSMVTCCAVWCFSACVQ